MPARDLDVWDQKPPFELDPSRWPEGDYGQGKTYRQDSDDSMAMLVLVVLFAVGFLVTAVVAGVALFKFVF